MLICAINCYKVKWATRVAVIFSFGKIVALLLIIGFGLYYLATGKFRPSRIFNAFIRTRPSLISDIFRDFLLGHVESFNNAFEGSNTSPGYLALAFYQGFWAFSGWLVLLIY